jgi:hypothetical protein
MRSFYQDRLGTNIGKALKKGTFSLRAALLDTPHAQRNFKNASLGLFDTWQEHAWHETAQSVYFEFDCEGGKQLGLKCSSLATERVGFSQVKDEEGRRRNATPQIH